MEYKPTNEVVEIDKEKLKKLHLRVYLMERTNFMSKRMKDNQMVDAIIKVIDTEAQNDN